MSALIAHSQDGMPVKRHFQVLGLCLWYLRSWQFFSALLPQAFLPSGMSAPTSFSNFAALAYCFKALAWVCTVASFQLQTYLLHRFSLCFFFFFRDVSNCPDPREEERLISKFKQCLCSRKMSITNEHIHYITCQGWRDSVQGCQISLYMPRYHWKLFHAFFKIIFVLLRACDGGT